MNERFLLDRQDFSVGHALRAASEHQVEPRQDAVGGGMQTLLLATIFASPIFWIALLWWALNWRQTFIRRELARNEITALGADRG